MQLAGGHRAIGAMRPAIDIETACSADPFTAVMVKSNGINPFFNQVVVEDIQHFQE
jgi:hypothetical protein